MQTYKPALFYTVLKKKTWMIGKITKKQVNGTKERKKSPKKLDFQKN